MLAAKMAAPPKRAPIPTAPVCMARAAPLAVLAVGVADPEASEPVGALVTVVDALTPDVNGASETDEAPGKAAAVVVGLGVAVALPGFSTLG